jgi:hypothetical protein
VAVLTGILIFLLGLIHILFGEISQIPELMRHLDDPVIIGSMRVMIYQGGVILLGVGALQFLKGSGRVELRGAASWIPVGIIVLNIVTFLMVGLISEFAVIRTALPQLVVFIVIIGLMLIELRGRRAAAGR